MNDVWKLPTRTSSTFCGTTILGVCIKATCSAWQLFYNTNIVAVVKGICNAEGFST